jgi:hypothetical protein
MSMQFRQKLAYMALGGVLVLAGHVLPGLVVGSATAQSGLQDAEFNEVTVRKLTVVDEATGATVVRMFGDANGGAVGVYQLDGTMAAGMMAFPKGGTILARGQVVIADGVDTGQIKLYTSSSGPTIGMTDSTGAVRVLIVATEDAAMLKVSHQDQGSYAAMSAFKGKSPSITLGRDGVEVVTVASTEEGGIVGVSDKYGEPEAGMAVDDNGDGFLYGRGRQR